MDYLSLFPGYVQEKPKFMALTAVVLQQATDLITLAQNIAPGFSVGSAVGIQLDAIGISFGIPRKIGWSDATYRTVLLRKLKRNTWDGTNATVTDYLESGETFCENGDGTVSVHTSGLPLPARELLPIPMGMKSVNV